MKKYLFLLIIPMLFIACEEDTSEFDALKEQVGELEARLDDLEATQKAELEAALAALEESLESLRASDENTQAAIDQLLADLLAIDDRVSINEGVFFGDVTNPDQMEIFAAGDYAIISGDVRVNSDEDMAALSNVLLIGGDLTFDGVEDIAMAIETVGGEIIFGRQAMTVDLPALKAVGNIQFNYYTAGITSIDLSGLTVVTGSLVYQEVSDATIGVPALVSVGDLVISYCNTTTDIEFPELISAASIMIDNIQSIDAINFDKLETIEGSLSISGISAGGGWIGPGFTPTMTVLDDFNALTSVESISIQNNGFLTQIVGFDALTNTHEVNIRYNRAITTVGGFGALTTMDEESVISISGNDILAEWSAFANLETAGSIFYQYNGNWPADVYDLDIVTLNALTSAKTINISGNGYADGPEFIGGEINTLNALTDVHELTITNHYSEFASATLLSELVSTGTQITVDLQFAADGATVSGLGKFQSVTELEGSYEATVRMKEGIFDWCQLSGYDMDLHTDGLKFFQEYDATGAWVDMMPTISACQ